MSLQAKFAFLLSAIAASVLLALGTAWWTLDMTYREVREPVRSASYVLASLIEIEKQIDELRALADSGDAFRSSPAESPEERSTLPPTRLDSAGFERHSADINKHLTQIEAEEWFRYAGKTATRNLRDKLAELASRAESHFTLAANPAGHELSTARISMQLFQIHELLKLMEQRLVDDIKKLADSSADLRSRLALVLGLSFLLATLTAILAYALLLRWVVRPVRNLRTAAERIAAGDFDHRIPLPASTRADEIFALSTEVNHMATMVNQMQIERIDQERLAAIGELVRRLAHNLRNPLAGIRGLAELTRSEVATLGNVAADVRENQDRIITAVDRFELWLTDLLSVTKPTQIECSTVNIPRWLAGLVDAHRPLAQMWGVKLDLDTSSGPTLAPIDPRHLEHAVSAILSNGLEAAASNTHTPEALRQVRVSSRVIQPSGIESYWELRIDDTGSGIPNSVRSSIFKPYFTTKQDGNGIGLAVARQVVRAHQGEIFVNDSELTPPHAPEATSVIKCGESCGTAFVIRLPLATSQPPTGG